uniref:IlGF domain-containing protein n=1 Tax=Macrostomum lignano TaxID=282301 RepID=A0A1I8JKM7_9PLAT
RARWPSWLANGRRRGCSGIKLAAFGTAPADAGGLAGFPQHSPTDLPSPQALLKLCSSSPHSGQSSKKLQTMRSSALTLSALVLLAVALCGSGSQQIRTRSGSGLAEPKLPRLCGIRLIRKLYEVCKDRGGASTTVVSCAASDATPLAAQLLKRTIGHSKLKCLIPKDDIVHHCCTCGRCTLSYMQLYCNY